MKLIIFILILILALTGCIENNYQSCINACYYIYSGECSMVGIGPNYFIIANGNCTEQNATDISKKCFEDCK